MGANKDSPFPLPDLPLVSSLLDFLNFVLLLLLDPFSGLDIINKNI